MAMKLNEPETTVGMLVRRDKGEMTQKQTVQAWKKVGRKDSNEQH